MKGGDRGSVEKGLFRTLFWLWPNIIHESRKRKEATGWRFLTVYNQTPKPQDIYYFVFDMQILGIQNRALKNIFMQRWIMVCCSDVKRKKITSLQMCLCWQLCQNLLKPAECFKSCWKEHHFHLIVYICGGVFISFTDAHSCYCSRTRPWLHAARGIRGTSPPCSSVIQKLPKFPQGRKGNSDT